MQDFEDIYAQYFSEVYKFALALCRDPDLAEELTQETFFKALKGIGRFKGECRLDTWLCSIAKHTFLSEMKRRKGQAELSPDELVSDERIEERFADREEAYRVHQLLHRLSEPYKEVFWLRTFGELSYAQIGALFGKTESWARVTCYRARMFLKEELQ